MKRTLAAIMALTMLASAVFLPSCDSGEDKPAETTTTQTPVTPPVLVEDGKPVYKIVCPRNAYSGTIVGDAFYKLTDALNEASGSEFKLGTDKAKEEVKEILVGNTTRAESSAALEGISANEYVIKVIGNKIVINGGSDKAIAMGVDYFIENYVTGADLTLALPSDLVATGSFDMSISFVHNITYEEMGDTVLRAFNNRFYNRGNLRDTEFWDAAEILESYIDAYEQTENPEYLVWVKAIAEEKFDASNANKNWCDSNTFNDDIAWYCIAFARIYLLTGEQMYLDRAIMHFDTMYARANNAPDVLGGGLWWKQDQLNTKNSCIQCPASIAACLIGKATEDDTYYEKAKEVMEWEFENLFISEGDNFGKVYDAYNTNGNKSDWSSTYNQGTFIGACMLLHEKYGDQKYLDYASAAANYAMTKLGHQNGALNGENNTLDLIGFKGILTRWLYRYAEYTNDMSILEYLQTNADVAYGNRSTKYNLIWTAWGEKTNEELYWDHEEADNGKYDVFGLSTAIALLFNCEPWW